MIGMVLQSFKSYNPLSTYFFNKRQIGLFLKNGSNFRKLITSKNITENGRRYSRAN
jgi:hypothetical protein